MATIPGVQVQHLYTCPEFLWLLYARTTIIGTSVSSVRLSYPYPEVLWILYDVHTRTWNFSEFCTARATIPGVRIQHFLFLPGTSVSSGRPCHNARSSVKSVLLPYPVPETSESSLRLPYPYPESTNPKEHNLGTFHVLSHCILVALLVFMLMVWLAWALHIAEGITSCQVLDLV